MGPNFIKIIVWFIFKLGLLHWLQISWFQNDQISPLPEAVINKIHRHYKYQRSQNIRGNNFQKRDVRRYVSADWRPARPIRQQTPSKEQMGFNNEFRKKVMIQKTMPRCI